MSQENEEVYRRWVDEVWIKGEKAIIDELFDENGVADYTYNLTNEPIQGRENYKKFVEYVRGLFTDIQVIIEQVASDEQKVIAYCTFKANRRAISEDEAAKPEPVEVSGLCQIIIENGKIISTWSNIDLLGTQSED